MIQRIERTYELFQYVPFKSYVLLPKRNASIQQFHTLLFNSQIWQTCDAADDPMHNCRVIHSSEGVLIRKVRNSCFPTQKLQTVVQQIFV